MASVSASMNVTRSGYQINSFPVIVTAEELSSDIASNTSRVKIKATISSSTTRTAWNITVGTLPSLVIYWNGSAVKSIDVGTMSAGGSASVEETITVTHNSDGSASGYAGVEWNKNASSSAVPADNSVNTPTLTLTRLARRAVVSLSASSITLTASADPNLKYSFTAISGLTYDAKITLVSAVDTKTSTSSGTTITKAWMLSAMHSTASATLTVELTTKSGSTVVGTSSATCAVTIDLTSIRPVISIGTIGGGTQYAGKTYATCPVTTTSATGAYSTTTTVTNNHATVSPTHSATTGSAVTFTSGVFDSSAGTYTATFTANARDSRGATAVVKTKSVTVNGYTAPSGELNAKRVATSTSTTSDGAGEYVYVTFTVTGSRVSSTVCKYSTSAGATGTLQNGGHFALAKDATATVTLTVTDPYTSAVVPRQVSTAQLPLDLYSGKVSNIEYVGAGIGAVAEANKCNIGIPTYHSQNVIISDENKTSYADGNAGIALHTNGNIVMASSGFPYLGFMSQNSTSYTVSIYEDSASHLNIRSARGQTLQTSAGTVLSTTSSGYIDLGVTGSNAYVNVKNAGLISAGFVMFGGKTGSGDGHAGGILESTGNLYLNHATNPQIYMMTNNAASIDATAQSTNVLRMGAYQKGYNNSWAKNAPALYVNGGVCGVQGVFWNGKPCVYAQDSTYAHTYSMSWDGTHLNFYVDGSLQKSI